MKYLCDKARHLICEPYSIKNLHKMAEDLGIKKCWYHKGNYPHYDIPKKRIDEITAKCELIETHIEEGLYNDEDEEGEEEDEDVVKRKQQLVISYLTDTLKNMGQDPYASMIENDIVRIDIDRRKFKINGQVYVKMSDKQNGKFHEGYIFIKDLPTYFTNYKLFEQVNKIKKIINYGK